MSFNLLVAESFYDRAEPIVLWLTIGVVCTLLVVGATLFFADRKSFAPYAKYALIDLALYALVVGLTMVIANLVKRTSGDYLENNYLDKDVIYYVLVPLIIAMAVTLASGITLFVASLKKTEKKTFKIIGAVSGGLSAAAVIAAAITIGVYYGRHIRDDGYYDGGYGEVNQTALYVCAAVLLVAVTAAAFLLGRKDKRPFDSRCIALAGICIALSFALSYIKLWEMPQGGSVTFASLLPVMLFAYVYGPKKGVLVGLIYGVLQAIQDPYIIHPAQFFLDYPIAFAMVGFTGAFSEVKALGKLPQVKFVLGAVLAGALRYLSHVLSGVFAFNAYALDQGQTDYWLYSLAYNSFVFVDLIMVVVAGALLFSSKSFVKTAEKFVAVKGKTATGETTASAEDATDRAEAQK